MAPLELARLQFATTAAIHFLFVLLTLGLVTLVVALQTAWLITKKPVYQRLTRFWGLLYVINYVLGIASGVVMEFQFGLNWSGLTKYLGNVFGAPLAIETLVAFFLESTFLGMWIFGWHRLGRGVHTVLIWLVALTAYASAFWVLVANSFLQNPVGYEMRDGVAHLTDFGALLRNPTLWMAFAHVCAAALTTGGFVMAGVSAWHFIRRTGKRSLTHPARVLAGDERELFRKSLRLGLAVGVVGATFVVGFGFAQFGPLGDVQPTKFNADSPEAAALVAQWRQQFGPGDYAHPTWTSTAFDVMQGFGLILFLAVFLIPLFFRDWIIRLRFPLYLLLIAVPLPFISAICGWLVREVGRQPWVAYGLVPTADAVSPVGRGTMLASYIGFTVLLGALAIADWVLLAKYANRGPDVDFGRPPDVEPAEPTPVLIGG